MSQTKQLLTIKEASRWASDFLKRDISESNISYLVQYGKVRKHNGGKFISVDANDLKNYYESYHGGRESDWRERLGKDLNWHLSFDHLREKDTTKHVHRLHPYKGKFIPQLVGYFTGRYFQRDDVILDPFSGSGTTLVQAREHGQHAIGIDVSHFNCMIAGVKLCDYDFPALERDMDKIKKAVAEYASSDKMRAFDDELSAKMAAFNDRHFSSPEFKRKIQRGQINESRYAHQKSKSFLAIYHRLVKKHRIKLAQAKHEGFLDRWFAHSVRQEIGFAFAQIKKIRNPRHKEVLSVILSRTMRSCRATTHSDLATLKAPQLTSYYCWKHKKICKPLFSMQAWFDRYAVDTLRRLKIYDELKSDAFSSVIAADSRKVDIFRAIAKRDQAFAKLLRRRKIRGIFTSPPYVGQIDYHEQHSYAYDLFGLKRKDDQEIGPLYRGQGAAARASYIEGVAQVLSNCVKYLADDFDIFLVANDKYDLYPTIADRAGLRIAHRFKRPVLNRTERDNAPYAEIIFHMKNGQRGGQNHGARRAGGQFSLIEPKSAPPPCKKRLTRSAEGSMTA